MKHPLTTAWPMRPMWSILFRQIEKGKGIMHSMTASAANSLPLEDCSQLNTLSKIVGWDVEYAQLQAGKLDGLFEFSLSQTLRIGRPATKQTMVVRGCPPQDCVALLLSETGGPPGIFQGQEFGLGQAAIMCPGQEGSYRTPALHQFNSVCIPVSRLHQALENSAGKPLASLLVGTRIIPLSQETLSGLRQLLNLAIIASPADTVGDACPDGIEQRIVEALANGLTAESRQAPRRVAQRLQVFHTARDYIEANLAGPLGLEPLATACGISLRTLRNSFQQVLGINPLQYIKLCRLQAARHLLLTGQSEEITVTDIAMRCGFTHLRYFARDYRALFAELPAQTLRGSR